MRAAAVKQHLQEHDILDVFLLLMLDGKRVKYKQVDLIKDYFTVREEEVCRLVKYFHKYGQDYNIQNLQWNYSFLYNTCSDDVRQKVVKKIQMLPIYHQGGPTFFFYLMETSTLSTVEASRSLVSSMKTMTQSKLDSENVGTTCSQLRSAIKGLSNVNKLPSDTNEVLINIFKSSSVEEFTA
eukprot:11153277-Ditylum_brightwellii.AAC.1